MNLRLCEAYRIIIPTDTRGDIGVLGHIRVLVDLCLKVLFYYELLNGSIKLDNFEVVL